MIIDGVTIGSGITMANRPLPFGEEVFFANAAISLLGSRTGNINGPLYGTANATYKWVVPAGVTSISVLCIGGGGAGGGGGFSLNGLSTITQQGVNTRHWSGSGGGGGGLSYANNIAVVPGTEYIIQVGGGGGKDWEPHDLADPDYGSTTNNWGRPTATSGGQSFFTTNAAIIAKQIPLVIANGGAAGKANLDCINGPGVTSYGAHAYAIYTLGGGGGGGAAGYKGAGGAGGAAGMNKQLPGGSGGAAAGTKKTAGFSGGAGGAASYIEDFTAETLGDSLPKSGVNAAANSGAGAGGAAEIGFSRAYLTKNPDIIWGTVGTQPGVPVNQAWTGMISGAYGGGGVGIYGAGADGKISNLLYSTCNQNGLDNTQLSSDILRAFRNCSGSGGADNRYDQTFFDYQISRSLNVPGPGNGNYHSAGSARPMSAGAWFGGGGGAPFSPSYIQNGGLSTTNGSQYTWLPLPGIGVGGPGAVRIVWPGNLRQFPSTRVQKIDHRATSSADDGFIDVEIVTVAGGGGGGYGWAYNYYSWNNSYNQAQGGGGGGAGGVARRRLRVGRGDRLTFIVGAGGGAGGVSYYEGRPGGDTSVSLEKSETPNSVQSLALAPGGGGGRSPYNTNTPQFSRGGSAGGTPGCNHAGGEGELGLGNNSARTGAGYVAGSGGGGAGTPSTGTQGGFGWSPSTYIGYIAGGGGGGAGSAETGGYAGAGGGGIGAGWWSGGYINTYAENGTEGTGGGGGGGSGARIYSGAGNAYTSQYGGAGGSGAVYLYINDINYRLQSSSLTGDDAALRSYTGAENPLVLYVLRKSGTITV